MKKLTTLTVKVKTPKQTKYNPKSLKKGMKIESEHTPSKKLKSIIAKNHLDEDQKYYDKLAKMEKKK